MTFSSTACFKERYTAPECVEVALLESNVIATSGENNIDPGYMEEW